MPIGGRQAVVPGTNASTVLVRQANLTVTNQTQTVAVIYQGYFLRYTEPICYSIHQLYPPQFRIVEVARVQKTASQTSAILA